MRRDKSKITISRAIALEILLEVDKGNYAEDVLSRKLSEQIIPANDRSLTTEIVYGVIRWKKRLDILIDRSLKNGGGALLFPIRIILRIAIYQLLFLNRIPPYSVVDQAVEQSKLILEGKFSALVNAVLRSALRNPQNLCLTPGQDAKSLALYYSHPEWLVKRWITEFGPGKTEGILRFNNQRSNLTIRVNKLKTSTSQLKSLLEKNFVEFDLVDKSLGALSLRKIQKPVTTLPGFKEGFFVVQDFASQNIAPLLQPIAGHQILDLCGAPGGKSAHMAQLVNNEARITLVDSNAERIKAAEQNLERLGINCVKIIQGDATKAPFFDKIGKFDRILVDAPCSNLGILRHNCDVKYRIAPGDLVKLADRQLGILLNSALSLKNDGVIVYSVCSVSKEETFDVVQKFLSLRKNFVIDSITPREICHQDFLTPNGCFRSFPPLKDFPADGFFAARLKMISG